MSVSSRDRRATRWAFVAAALLMAQEVAGRATRDALFLSYFPATEIPRVIVVGALLSLVSAFGAASLLGRREPARSAPSMLGLWAVVTLGNWAWMLARPEQAIFFLYLQMMVFAPLVFSGFWSVVNERFDPHSAKQTVARVAAFAALGGVFGGGVSHLAAAVLPLHAMLPVLAGLNGLAGLALLGVGAPEAAAAEPAGPPPGLRDAVRTARRSPFLLQMGGLLVIGFVIDTFLEYALKSAASARFQDGGALIRFFAIYYTSVSLVTFGLQAGVGPRVLRRFGLGGAMAFMPIGVMLCAGLAAIWPRLGTMVLARGVESVLNHSLFDSGFQLLWTPLEARVKRPTKPFIDVGGQRIGDMSGGVLLMGLLFAVPDLPDAAVAALAAILCLASLYLISRLHNGYVGQLAARLKTGALNLDESSAMDATTARTIAESQLALDRHAILERIAERRASDGETVPVPEDAPPVEGAADDAGAETRELLDRIAALCGDDAGRAARALREAGADPRLVPHALDRLGRDESSQPMLEFLGRLADRRAGQISDALLDRDRPLAVRALLPGVLSRSRSARAVEGLCDALRDDDFRQRARCARAAARIVARDPERKLSEERVYELVVDQVQRGGGVGMDESGPASVESSLSGRRDRTSVPPLVAHVFHVLCLAFDRDLMRSAVRGLFSNHPHLRGTALEYLEVTLPAAVRAEIWPLVSGGAEHPQARRSRKVVADDLLKTFEALEVDRGSENGA